MAWLFPWRRWPTHKARRAFDVISMPILRIIKSISRYVFGAFFILVGIRHFTDTPFFLKIMPPYLPLHLEAVYVSGIFEVLLGALLMVRPLARWAGWGLILLLIAVFPANIYVYQHQDLVPASPLLHTLRLPLQAVMIAWAYWYTRPEKPKSPSQLATQI